jgi:RNA polymerase sigma-70 factor (ECF subfamily)
MRRFEETVLPHLDAAFNYARWLTRDRTEAEDVVQDACVRAMRFFGSSRHENPRAWFMTIVRNTWLNRATRRPAVTKAVRLDDAGHEMEDEGLDPEEQLFQQHAVAQVRAALERLPVDFREVLVLREIEGLSYKEIGAVLRVPTGTVMSRLSRARDRLAALLEVAPHMETLR